MCDTWLRTRAGRPSSEMTVIYVAVRSGRKHGIRRPNYIRYHIQNNPLSPLSSGCGRLLLRELMPC